MPIRHPDLYDAVYAAMLGMQPEIPLLNMAPRTRVLRIAPVAYAGRRGADLIRTVYQSSINDDNRWTGPRPRHVTSAKPAAGGVYTAVGLNDAGLGELTYYAMGTTLDEDVNRMLAGQPTKLDPATFSATLATKRIFEYGVTPSIPFVDFSLISRTGSEFLRALDSLPQVSHALRVAGFRHVRGAYLADKNHSLPRAMAQVVRDVLPGCRAIRVTSVRAESALAMQDEQAENFVFFGADGVLLTDLTPLRETWFTKAANGKFEGVSAPL